MEKGDYDYAILALLCIMRLNFISKFYILILFACSLSGNFVYAQTTLNKDSLLQQLTTAKEDTNKVNILNALSTNLFVTKTDSALLIANEALKLAQKIGSQKGIGEAYHSLSNCYSVKNNYDKQIEFLLKELEICIEKDNKTSVKLSII